MGFEGSAVGAGSFVRGAGSFVRGAGAGSSSSPCYGCARGQGHLPVAFRVGGVHPGIQGLDGGCPRSSGGDRCRGHRGRRRGRCRLLPRGWGPTRYAQVKYAVDASVAVGEEYLFELSGDGGPSILQKITRSWQALTHDGARVQLALLTIRLPDPADDLLKDRDSGTGLLLPRAARQGRCPSVVWRVLSGPLMPGSAWLNSCWEDPFCFSGIE